MKNTFKAMNAEAQNKTIKSLASRGNKLKQDAISLANGFLLHYIQHGDMSNAMQIADTLAVVYTKGVRKAFIDWTTTFATTLQWNEEAKEIVHIKGQERKLDRDISGNQHFEVDFFQFVAEKEKPSVYIDKVIESTIKRLMNGIQNDKASNYNTKQLDALVKFSLEQKWIDPDKGSEILTNLVDDRQTPRKASKEVAH